MRQFRFSPALPLTAPFTIGDGLILLAITTLVYAGARLAFHTPAVIAGPDISLSPLALPWYALLSVGRMAAAYFLSLLFSLFYGYAAARNRTARAGRADLRDRVLLPAHGPGAEPNAVVEPPGDEGHGERDGKGALKRCPGDKGDAHNLYGGGTFPSDPRHRSSAG